MGRTRFQRSLQAGLIALALGCHDHKGRHAAAQGIQLEAVDDLHRLREHIGISARKGGMNRKAGVIGQYAQRLGRRRGTDDQQSRPGDDGIEKDIQGASTVTGHTKVDDARFHLPALARADADQARLAILEDLFGRIQHRGLCTATPDPADQIAFRSDQGLGARLGRRGRFRPHHRGQHEGGAIRLELLCLVQY